MLHSLILNQGSSLAIKEYLQTLSLDLSKNHPDLLQLKPNPSIGIKDIKMVVQFLSKKPYQAKIKSVIIDQAHLLTKPAQNAFLKTLEEPPAHSRIILITDNLSQLLPTITSRCQVINLTQPNPKQSLLDHKTISAQLTKASLKERLDLTSTYSASKKAAISWIHNHLLFIKSNLPSSLSLAKKLKTSHQLLQSNVNPKLVIENLMLHYPRSPKIDKIREITKRDN